MSSASMSSFHGGIPTGASSVLQQNSLFNVREGANTTTNTNTATVNLSPSINRQLQPLDRSTILRKYQLPPKTMEESKFQVTSIPPTAPSKLSGGSSNDSTGFPRQWQNDDALFSTNYSSNNTHNTASFCMIPPELKLPYTPKAVDGGSCQSNTASQSSSRHQQGRQAPSSFLRSDRETPPPSSQPIVEAPAPLLLSIEITSLDEFFAAICGI